MADLECEAMRDRLLAVRANRGLTRTEVARSAGVSNDTIRHVEEGRTLPGVDTAEKLARALGLDPRWLVYGAGSVDEGSARTIIVTPGYDPIRMCREMREALAVPNGFLLDSYKYLDPAGAEKWTQIVADHGFSAVIQSMPLSSLVEHLVSAIGEMPYDVWGLGAGTGNTELSLVARLVAKGQREARVFLVDVSQPLLIAAMHNVERMLSKSRHHPIPVVGLLADFNQFAAFGLLPGSGRRRVITMFGATFSNLDNEVRFLRRSLAWASKGDILVLDVPRAAGETDEAITKNDSALRQRNASQWSDLLDPFLTGPILRHVPGVSKVKVSARLDRRSSVVPGSYAIEFIAEAKLVGGEQRQFSIGYSKRYDLDGFTKLMGQEGWSRLCSFEYGPGFLLCAFRRELSPQIQKQGRPRRKATDDEREKKAK